MRRTSWKFFFVKEKGSDLLGPWHRSDINIFPDVAGMEANYFAAAGGLPRELRLEITIPSTVDDSLAPAGHHVMSVLAKYYPYELADGSSWDDIKENAADDVIRYMSRTMPNLPDLIVGRHLISPLALETEYGLTESDIFHGRHDLDQLFSLRPDPKADQYRTCEKKPLPVRLRRPSRRRGVRCPGSQCRPPGDRRFITTLTIFKYLLKNHHLLWCLCYSCHR